MTLAWKYYVESGELLETQTWPDKQQRGKLTVINRDIKMLKADLLEGNFTRSHLLTTRQGNLLTAVRTFRAARVLVNSCSYIQSCPCVC